MIQKTPSEALAKYIVLEQTHTVERLNLNASTDYNPFSIPSYGSMYANKKWPKIVIFLVMALAIYNILPTVFYYIQPLHQPLSEKKGIAIAQSIDRRLSDLEADSLHWIRSLAQLLHITPKEILPLPGNPEVFSLSFSTLEEAQRLRAKLPRASALTSFAPLGWTLLNPEEQSTTVWLARNGPAPFGQEALHEILTFRDTLEPVTADRLTAIQNVLISRHGPALSLRLRLQHSEEPLRPEEVHVLALQLLPWARLAQETPSLHPAIVHYFAHMLEQERLSKIQSFLSLVQKDDELSSVHELLRSIAVWNGSYRIVAEHPLFAAPYIQEGAIHLPLHAEVAQLHAEGKIGQILMDELAYLSRETEEEFIPCGAGFTAALSTQSNASRFLLIDLEQIAHRELDKVAHTLRALWNPIHPDLMSENFPIVTHSEWLSLPPEERLFSLCLSTASERAQDGETLHRGSIYLQVKGLDRILQGQASSPLSSLLESELKTLSHLLQQLGFTPTVSTTRDPLFARKQCYEPLLMASRESFLVRGSAAYAVLECSSLEERIARENQIDSTLHSELLRWHDEYRAAQIHPNPALHSDVPKPPTHPLWSNFKLNAAKYVRGDERKILRWGLDLSGGKSVEIALVDQNHVPIVGDAEIQQGMEELAQRINKMSLAEVAIRQIGHHIVVDFPSSFAESATDLIQPSSMRFHLIHEKFSLKNPLLASHVERFLEEVWNEAVATHHTDPKSVREIAWNHFHATSHLSESARVLAQEGLHLANPIQEAMDTSLNEELCQVALWSGKDPREWHGQSHPLLFVFHHYALEGAGLDNIRASYDPSKGNFLSFEIKEAFSEPFSLWTTRYAKSSVIGTDLETASRGQGWRMAVLLNDQVISAPTLDSPLRESAQISGNFSQREITQLTKDLKAGSFTFTPQILSEKNVDAQLGQNDRMQGIAATLCAFAMVLGAMIAYYRFAGCVASLAVLFNLLILWAVLQNLGAALTLSGIAGIILTVAMSVDANVLVFERMKEEYAKSKQMANAIAAGYQKAYSAIIDSNVTTLIAALILLQFEAGPLKSFAMNLILGIISSMFTALFVTQVYFESWVRKKERKPLSMAHWIRNPHFDFLRRAKGAFLIALMLIGLGTSLTWMHRTTLWGMDFTGGFVMDLELAESASPEAIVQAFTCQGVAPTDVQVQTLGTPTHHRLFLSKTAAEPGPSFAWVVDTLHSSKIVLAPHAASELATNWTSISGQISDAMQRQALFGLALALLFCFVYITLRFEYPFAMAALLCVLHDLCITLAAIGILHAVGCPVQIDLNTVAALMTILGYSLNDTIIIFDRIREERALLKHRSFSQAVNEAINATLSRTTITSGTTLLALLSLVLFGSGSIFSFACVMIVGVVLGTLSSWFIAAPLLLFFHRRQKDEPSMLST